MRICRSALKLLLVTDATNLLCKEIFLFSKTEQWLNSENHQHPFRPSRPVSRQREQERDEKPPLWVELCVCIITPLVCSITRPRLHKIGFTHDKRIQKKLKNSVKASHMFTAVSIKRKAQGFKIWGWVNHIPDSVLNYWAWEDTTFLVDSTRWHKRERRIQNELWSPRRKGFSMWRHVCKSQTTSLKSLLAVKSRADLTNCLCDVW